MREFIITARVGRQRRDKCGVGVARVFLSSHRSVFSDWLERLGAVARGREGRARPFFGLLYLGLVH